MDKYFHPIFYWACDYLSILGLQLNHVSEKGHGYIWSVRRATKKQYYNDNNCIYTVLLTHENTLGEGYLMGTTTSNIM